MFRQQGFFFGKSLIHSWRTENTIFIGQLDYKYDNIQHALLCKKTTTLITSGKHEKLKHVFYNIFNRLSSYQRTQ